MELSNYVYFCEQNSSMNAGNNKFQDLMPRVSSTTWFWYYQKCSLSRNLPMVNQKHAQKSSGPDCIFSKTSKTNTGNFSLMLSILY